MKLTWENCRGLLKGIGFTLIAFLALIGIYTLYGWMSLKYPFLPFVFLSSAIVIGYGYVFALQFKWIK